MKSLLLGKVNDDDDVNDDNGGGGGGGGGGDGGVLNIKSIVLQYDLQCLEETSIFYIGVIL